MAKQDSWAPVVQAIQNDESMTLKVAILFRAGLFFRPDANMEVRIHVFPPMHHVTAHTPGYIA